MTKYLIAASVLLMASTGAFAAPAIGDCCAAFAACCETALGCCG